MKTDREINLLYCDMVAPLAAEYQTRISKLENEYKEARLKVWESLHPEKVRGE